MSGLRYESLADLPEKMRRQVAGKLLEGKRENACEGNSGERILRLPAVAQDDRGERILRLPAVAQDDRGERIRPLPSVAQDDRGERKYRNQPVEVNGIKFDSRKEARRYEQLMAAMEMGFIRDLRLQVDFTLIEAFTDAEGKRHQALRYKADFTYKVAVISPSGPTGHLPHQREALADADMEYWRKVGTGSTVIEDVKSAGTRTRVYINKKKLMAEKGYSIREV